MNVPPEWQLDPGFDHLLDSRARDKMGWKGDHKFQFNGPTTLYRQIVDFVAKCDLYANQTEFCINALYWYADRVLSELPDGYGGMMRAQHDVDRQHAELVRREVLLQTATDLLSKLWLAYDMTGLRDFVANMEMHLADLDSAPAPYRESIQKLVQEAQEYVYRLSR